MNNLSDKKLSDRQLFLAMCSGNEGAFREFYDAYERRVYGFLYKILRSHNEVEELSQVVFVKIWESRTQKNPDLSTDAWVFKIAKNSALDVLRQKARKLLLEKQLIDNFKISEDGENALIDKDLKRYMDSLMTHIPERRREIFKLRYENELSYKEIAEKLNISENTVDTQIRRALNYFREKLGNELWSVALPLITFFSILKA